MKKEISILIPCFNGEKYISRCIDSCLNQTYKNIKIIIVNDGSTDESENIIKKYMKQNKNITLISQQNKGLAKTRNILLKKCNTKYAFFLDADDWLESNAILTFVSGMDKEYKMVVNSCYVYNGKNKKEFYITKSINSSISKMLYIKNNTFFAWNILFDCDWVKKENLWFYDETSFFEDAGIMLIWFLKADKIKFIRNPVYNYDISNMNSLSHSKKMNFEKIDSAIKQLNNLYLNLRVLYEGKEIDNEVINQLSLYHCIIFTYIQFQSNITKLEKKNLKTKLKSIEKNNWKLKFPKKYWKFWYFILYRIFLY